ncbi:MAG: hypothetical protein PWP21_185 [Thermosediminibacterales bacterium]|nr:hypothetical protein [Thermosediminibacterales bacterium]
MRKKSKLLVMLLLSVLIAGFFQTSSIQAQEIELKCESAILVEASTGKILLEKNPHEKLSPASITKIMTLLLAMEAIESGKANLDDKVIVSKNARDIGGTTAFLDTGEEISLENLLKSIAIASANDACVAVAEHIAGSEEGFVNLMNKRAKELGMVNTHFVNPHGLPAENHYTTAYDISLMSRALIKHKKIFDWTTVWLDYLKHTDRSQNNVTMLANTNKLIRWYKGVDGLKTGSHSKAKYCIAATAKRDGLRLISVIMKAPDTNTRFKEAAKLLDYGFANYSSIKIAEEEKTINTVKVEKGLAEKVGVVTGEDFNIIVKKGEEEGIDCKVLLPEKVKAPIKKGQKIGEIIVYKGNQEIARHELIAEKDVPKITFLQIITRLINQFLRR